MIRTIFILLVIIGTVYVVRNQRQSNAQEEHSVKAEPAATTPVDFDYTAETERYFCMRMDHMLKADSNIINWRFDTSVYPYEKQIHYRAPSNQVILEKKDRSIEIRKIFTSDVLQDGYKRLEEEKELLPYDLWLETNLKHIKEKCDAVAKKGYSYIVIPMDDTLKNNFKKIKQVLQKEENLTLIFEKNQCVVEFSELFEMNANQE